MEIKPLTYKWLSALMCYPERDLIDALPEFQAALNELPELKNNPYRDDLDKLLNHLSSHTLRELQEDYVLVFEEYRRYGFELGDDELPDYLPALLEFFSHIPADEAQKLLGDAVHVIAHIAKKLDSYGSPYAALLNATVALSPVEPQPLIDPPVRDMDEAMETFGPDNQGLEPLLKPKASGIQTVQFYPHGNRPM